MSFLRPVLLQNGKLTVAPVGNVTWEVRPLINGASKNLAIVTAAPTTFSFIPESGTTYYLNGLSVVFSTSGTPDPTKFGNIAALTNGIDLDIKSNGVTTTAINIKDNLDLALTFSQFTNLGGSKGFLNNAFIYTGSVNFMSPILIQASSSDFVRAVVKSPTNNSGSELRIYAHVYKQI